MEPGAVAPAWPFWTGTATGLDASDCAALARALSRSCRKESLTNARLAAGDMPGADGSAALPDWAGGFG
jgi:hypothetical protein